MPLTCGDLDNGIFVGTHNLLEDDVACITIEALYEPATNHNHGLGGVLMSMDGHDRTWLKGVKHPLALVG